jgi:hypothetical protein
MAEPTYFLITGMPKSGNKWLHNMVFELDGIGGFANHPRDGLPLLAQKVWDETPIFDFCRASGRTFESFFRKLYNPADPGWEPLDEQQREMLRPPVRRLMAAARRVQPGGRHVQMKHFAQLFRADHGRESITDGQRAVGTPGMHVPIGEVVEHLPGFRIVHLVRDPRDVVVSYFYHLVASLRTNVAEKAFVTRDRSGRLLTRSDWKKRYGQRAWRRFEKFFGRQGQAVERMIAVRYEDLLVQAPHELERVGAFLGVDTDPAQRRDIAQRHSFAAKTGSTAEQRNSMTRKGKSGDWRNYFDQELLRGLGRDFRRLVVELGYEPDEAWIDEVPERAPREFEFSRFRIRRSTCRHFIKLWMASTELQERFPDPWDYGEGETFYHWLREHDDKDVTAWNKLADELQTLWAVDIVEARD